MNKWMVIFRKRDKRKEKLVCLESVQKLLRWIEKNASSCAEIHIIQTEDYGRGQ